MKPEDIAWRRLAGQFLTTPGPAAAADVVRRLGAVQAQDYPGARWALSQRTRDGLSEAEVEAEADSGAILRTHVLRSTWHFVAPEDIRWMLGLTAPRISRVLSYYNGTLGLTKAVFRRSHAAIARALEGGRQLTRAELKAVLERARVPLGAQRLGRLLEQAELDLLICSGCRRDGRSTHALLDERVPRSAPRDRDDALGELARRYFTTRGPATVHDFAWWSGLIIADARRAVDAAGKAVARIDIDGRPHWMAPAAPEPPRRARAHLLPNYDEYFIGLKDRGAIGRRLGNVTRVTGGNAMINHVVLVNGQLAGGWKRLAPGSSPPIAVTLDTPLTAAERRLVDREVKRYARFLDCSPDGREGSRAEPNSLRRSARGVWGVRR